MCLPESSAPRSIYRNERADLIEAHQQRMAASGQARMRQRAGLVEHPSSTLKRWLGWEHFLVRGFYQGPG